MPKAVLEFNLPEEKEEFELAQRGISYKIVLDDLDNWLRAKVKYEDMNIISVNSVREKLRELMEEQEL
jgi:hypothetical protein